MFSGYLSLVSDLPKAKVMILFLLLRLPGNIFCLCFSLYFSLVTFEFIVVTFVSIGDFLFITI